MKGATVLCVSMMLVAQTVMAVQMPVFKSHKMLPSQVLRLTPQAQNVGLDKCKMCIEFADQALNTLLNLVLQGGVVGGCQELCSALASKTSPAIGTVCNILCDIVGIEEFIKIINNADLDPIYYCELIPACPIKDDGDCKITKLEVAPKSGPQGKFDIKFEYASVNGTGTGEIVLEIVTVDGNPLEQSFLHELAAAGTYDGDFQLDAKPDPNCDPSQGPCEMWLPGNYTVKMAVCNGECGSKHPHSEIYDETSTSFTITE